MYLCSLIFIYVVWLSRDGDRKKKTERKKKRRSKRRDKQNMKNHTHHQLDVKESNSLQDIMVKLPTYNNESR